MPRLAAALEQAGLPGGAAQTAVDGGIELGWWARSGRLGGLRDLAARMGRGGAPTASSASGGPSATVRMENHGPTAAGLPSTAPA